MQAPFTVRLCLFLLRTSIQHDPSYGQALLILVHKQDACRCDSHLSGNDTKLKTQAEIIECEAVKQITECLVAVMCCRLSKLLGKKSIIKFTGPFTMLFPRHHLPFSFWILLNQVQYRLAHRCTETFWKSVCICRMCDFGTCLCAYVKAVMGTHTCAHIPVHTHTAFYIKIVLGTLRRNPGYF